jgi:hypothetical protein
MANSQWLIFGYLLALLDRPRSRRRRDDTDPDPDQIEAHIIGLNAEPTNSLDYFK